jgi:hypothetical protein
MNRLRGDRENEKVVTSNEADKIFRDIFWK